MTYEEKREFHKIISQMLADEGLNKGRLKEIVEEEIRIKVKSVVEQTLASLDAQTDGRYKQGYIEKYIHDALERDIRFNSTIQRIIKDEISNRIIEVSFSDKVKHKEDQ